MEPIAPLVESLDSHLRDPNKGTETQSSISDVVPTVQNDLPAPRASLEGLPTEIQHMIIREYLSPKDVLSLIRTSKIIYIVFKKSEQFLSNAIVHRYIAPDARYAARLAFRSPRLRGMYTDKAEAFWARRDEGSLIVDNIRQAQAMHRLHEIVESLAVDMSTQALKMRPASAPITETEMARFQKSFYIYETYWKLFPSNRSGEPRTQIKEFRFQFFSMLKPWEITQLVCVHEYLADKMREPMAIFREHDLESKYREHFYPATRSLSQALRFAIGVKNIFAICNCESWESLQEAMNVEDTRNADHLMRDLWHYYSDAQGSGVDVALKDLTPQQKKAIFGKSLDEKNLDGPAKTWYSLKDFSSDYAYCLRQSALRDWAFVFWDQQRIDQWGDMKAFEACVTADSRSLMTSDQGFSKPIVFLQPSWLACRRRQPQTETRIDLAREGERLHELYHAGGRGLVLDDDESHVVWPKDGPSPLDNKSQRDACLKCRDSEMWTGLCRPHSIVLRYPDSYQITLNRAPPFSEEDED